MRTGVLAPLPRSTRVRSQARVALPASRANAPDFGNTFGAVRRRYAAGTWAPTRPLPRQASFSPGTNGGTSPGNLTSTAIASVSAANSTGGTAPAAQVGTTSTGTQPQNAVKPLGNPLSIAEFPRPKNDNGRGMHWVPTLFSDRGTVDRFVREAKEMGVDWMVILNNDARIGDNDYLVDQLVKNGIMPIMRLYTPNGEKIKGDVEALVRHYRARGVYYYQLYNEPNLKGENPDRQVNIDRYLDYWLPAARAVVRAGGYPGFGSLAPGGNFDDMEFLRTALDRIKARGEVDTLDRAWLSMHNYTFNHPLDYQKDSNGFLKFRFYDTLVRNALGRSMPIIGTEGGTFLGQQEDRTFPAVTNETQVRMVRGAYDYMARPHEAYYFAYSYWVIANEEGGGRDPSFTNHALFRKGGGASPVVDALKSLTKQERTKS